MADFEDICPGVSKRLEHAGDRMHAPVLGSDVWVHYSCLLQDGRHFVDSSRGETPSTVGGLTVMKKAKPFRFTVGSGDVIQAWEIALPTMSLGERSTFRFGSGLCYGEKGKGEAVPPNSAMEYDLELVGVNGKYFVS